MTLVNNQNNGSCQRLSGLRSKYSVEAVPWLGRTHRSATRLPLSSRTMPYSLPRGIHEKRPQKANRFPADPNLANKQRMLSLVNHNRKSRVQVYSAPSNHSIPPPGLLDQDHQRYQPACAWPDSAVLSPAVLTQRRMGGRRAPHAPFVSCWLTIVLLAPGVLACMAVLSTHRAPCKSHSFAARHRERRETLCGGFLCCPGPHIPRTLKSAVLDHHGNLRVVVTQRTTRRRQS
jgi:hypothetical protein